MRKTLCVFLASMIIADITPPVALAAYAGAAISGGNPMNTGVNASKLAIAAFIVPYLFVYSPGLLMIDVTVPALIYMTCTALIGMVGLGASTIGFFVTKASVLERVLFFIGGIMLVDPGVVTDVIGVSLLAIAVTLQITKKRRQAMAA
jgi:TRAP-type uncharacterized transport system fused permease subunit